MAKKRFTPETIIRKLREAEDLQGQGQTIAQTDNASNYRNALRATVEIGLEFMC